MSEGMTMVIVFGSGFSRNEVLACSGPGFRRDELDRPKLTTK
jgi:hypothetical protein